MVKEALGHERGWGLFFFYFIRIKLLTFYVYML